MNVYVVTAESTFDFYRHKEVWAVFSSEKAAKNYIEQQSNAPRDIRYEFDYERMSVED